MDIYVRRKRSSFWDADNSDDAKGKPIFVDGTEVGRVRPEETVHISGPNRNVRLQVGSWWASPTPAITLLSRVTEHRLLVTKPPLLSGLIGTLLGLLLALTPFVAAAFVLEDWPELNPVAIGVLASVVVSGPIYIGLSMRSDAHGYTAAVLRNVAFSVLLTLLLSFAAVMSIGPDIYEPDDPGFFLLYGGTAAVILVLSLAKSAAWPGARRRIVRESGEGHLKDSP